ncbi:MAG TPA: hypothetical protein VI728_08285 [Syntrophales bacterium]|nr:hypothetical protein [Syntrophales bacterium]
MQIGHLVNFFVVKAMPDYDSYLVCLQGGELLALLPRKYANRLYKVGETGWAAVFEIKGARINLSQKSPQYIRKILEYLTAPLIQEKKIRFKKVALVAGAPFCKVAVAVDNEMSQKDLVELCKPYLADLKQYIAEHVTFVKYSDDIEKYVVNALSPGPKKAIKKVIFFQESNTAAVYVKSSSLAIFYGRHGQNVAAAAKLTGITIEIKGD